MNDPLIPSTSSPALDAFPDTVPLRNDMNAFRRRNNGGPWIWLVLCVFMLFLRPNAFGARAAAMSSSRDFEELESTTPTASFQHQNVLGETAYYSSEAMENILPHHMFRNNNIAVIIETDPAKVPTLVPIMLHFATTLGPNWPVVLFTLQKNWEAPPSMDFRQLMDSKRIIVLYLPPDTAFPDHKSVTRFLVRPWLWQLFAPANRVLMFQVDSILCSQSTRRVEDFLEWDFIGAPIVAKYGFGYNGGLSIRNPSLFLEAAKEQQKNPQWLKAEDQWYYDRLRERGAHLPSEDEAKLFAVETVYYEQPLGYHQPARWQKNRMPEIMKWCPEVQMLTKGQHFF